MGLGGGTKVSQTTQAAQATNVNVDIANNIDTSPIADALSQFGGNISDFIQTFLNTEQSNQEAESKNRQQEILAILGGAALQAKATEDSAAVEADKAATIKKVSKFAMGSVIVYAAYEIYRKAK